MPSPEQAPNVAFIAAAGARKTQLLIESALADASQRVLITTYTNENLRQITRRIEQRNGIVPSNIAVVGWFSFLMNQAARPYQRAITNETNFLGSLNFIGQRSRPSHPGRSGGSSTLTRTATSTATGSPTSPAS
jgi:hypothetical protein